MIYDSKATEKLREKYPTGTRIRLENMDDPYNAVPSGTCGTVAYVDDACNIHMKWDDGRMLALVPNVDRFAVIKRELTPLKLYMPLHCDLYTRNEYGDLEEYPEHIDHREALEYADNILAEIVKYRMPEEATRGLMHWYREPDSVNEKVHRAEFSVEQRSGAL